MKPEGRDPPASGAPAAIVIGGSAGALEALLVVLAGLPATMTIPVVVVLHIPRRKPSLLANLLGQSLGRPVREPEDKEPLAPSVVYVAPPDYHLLVDHGPVFSLSVDEPVNFSMPSIDVLFESAADALGPRLVGVVLSGANADGAKGLRAIVQAGGLALIQAPEQAPSSAMPAAAIGMCPGARVLPTESIRDYLHGLERGGKEGGHG
jgi:two-component system, chemotaxis family, protein-glutamate methylesterase/glutaminase